jgi:hypothetical protein
VVRVENAGHGTLAGLTVGVQPDAGWLAAPAASPDTAPAAFTVAIDPASAWRALYATGGTDTRNVVVSAAGAPVTLPVTLDVRGSHGSCSHRTRSVPARDTAASGTPDDSVESPWPTRAPGR